MDRSPPDGLHDEVSGALETEASLHRAPVALGELDRVGTAEEVRRVK